MVMIVADYPTDNHTMNVNSSTLNKNLILVKLNSDCTPTYWGT